MKKIIIAALFSVGAFAWVCAKDRWETIEDWLAAWMAAFDEIAPWPSCCKYEYNKTPWSVTATVGSHGAQTVSGEAACIGSSGNSSTQPGSAVLNGVNCWCRMTSPRSGSWVFLYDDYGASNCSRYCAFVCALCVRDGSNDSCSRGAVLK